MRRAVYILSMLLLTALASGIVLPASAAAQAPKQTLAVPPSVDLGTQLRALSAEQSAIAGRITDLEHSIQVNFTGTRTDIFNGYISVFVVAFAITLGVVPIFRKLAIAYGIIDHPDETRKAHKFPVAYMGGVAVWCGMAGAIAFSYIAPRFGLMTFHNTNYITADFGTPFPVPLSILFGMTIVMFVGLWDDIAQISPLQKIGGQLLAAALLAMNDIGVKVAKQVLTPIGEWLGNPSLAWTVTLPFNLPIVGDNLPVDVVYWTGTAIIAIFVLGACNASNLIDGLDGLLSGVTAIAAAALLIVALGLAVHDDGQYDAARIILCLAVLGACLGYLPHNFNPATIFLGDAGSLLLGYATIVIILLLGDTGRTNLVLAGLIIFAIPIVDTSLAIVRRKLTGQKISAADDQHLHHILKRKLGVKGAVLVLYMMGAGFGALGILLTLERGRITYALTLVFLAFIGVTAIKVARRKQFEEQALLLREKAAGAAGLGNQASDSPGPTPQPVVGSK